VHAIPVDFLVAFAHVISKVGLQSFEFCELLLSKTIGEAWVLCGDIEVFGSLSSLLGFDKISFRFVHAVSAADCSNDDNND